ncbi:hypothetical protein BJY01DRAFT_250305 [Aspergillus pseudoustus]|uniref:Mid2 domain-containing protein n=1 Tax=Aspergillus pseudoustus TaxID=1810923 RepID=A0ABR4JIF5_9EURO
MPYVMIPSHLLTRRDNVLQSLENSFIDSVNITAVDVQHDRLCTIVPYNSTAEGISYCCNSIVNNPDDVNPECAFNKEPITLQSATIIPGVVLLEDYTLESDVNCTTTTNNNNNNNNNNTPATNETATNEVEDKPSAEQSSSTNVAAVGAGVGVPLGVLSLLAVAWALFERRKRMSLQNSEKVVRELSPNSGAYAVLGNGFPHKSITSQQPPHYREPLELEESSPGSNRG